MITDNQAPDIAGTVISHWVAALENALTSMTSHEYDLKCTSLDSKENGEISDEQWVWWSQEVSLVPGAALWVGGAAQTWQALGGPILAALGVDGASEEDCQSAARDMIARATSALVHQLSLDFKCHDPEASAAPSGPWTLVSITRSGIADLLELRLAFDNTFLEELSKLPKASTGVASATGDPPPARPLPKNIADLSLNLSVALGRITLPLEKVLKLNVGSLLELNKPVAGLADVVVNGNIIASGTVVVCNGYYAVQVVPPDLS